jgi:hypothetical protein
MFNEAAVRAQEMTAINEHVVARGIGAFGIVLIAALGIGYVVFFLAALLSVLGAPVGCAGKLLWFMVILCLPFLGSLLWFVAGRPRD